MPRRLALPLFFLLASCNSPTGPADASREALQAANTRVSVPGVALEQIQLRGILFNSTSRDQFLVIRLRIDNTGTTKIVKYRRNAVLTDAFGNTCEEARNLTGLVNAGHAFADIRPGESVEDVLTFHRPVDAAEYVDLQVTRFALEGEGGFLLRIPRSMWQKEN